MTLSASTKTDARLLLSYLYVLQSDLSMEQYHALSDATMDTMLDSLESLLDDFADPEYEVEYHVRVPTALRA